MLIGPMATAVGPLLSSNGPAHDIGDASQSASLTSVPPSNGAAPMAGPRAVTIARLLTAPPVINGVFNNPNEWLNAQKIDSGQGANLVKIYLEADGTWLYVLVDDISDTDQSATDTPPPPMPKEYTAMIWDGNNDGKISYASGAPGSTGISYGGKNADFGFIFWGDNQIWNASVTTSGNSITFSVGSGGNSMAVTGFGATPNSGTAHRVHEYKIAYDAAKDDLGCSIGYSFTKGFNLQTFRNITNVATVIGQWPTNLVDIGTSFDSAILPQKFPHIVKAISPKDGDVFQTGQTIKFEIDATDNNLSTLARTLYLETTPYDMGANNFLIMNNVPAGVYNISYKITDDEGFSDTIKAGKITVSEAEVSPVIDSFVPIQPDPTIDEGKKLDFSIKWHDLNLDQKNESMTVTWTVDDKPANSAWISSLPINTTYALANLTYTADYTTAGTHTIKLSLQDSYFGGMPPVEHSWTLKVNNINRPPEIRNPDPDPSSILTISEQQSAEFKIEKLDLDNTPHVTQTLFVKWYVNNVEQTHSSNMDNFTFNANPPHYGTAGKYVVKVSVTDLEATTSVQWNVTITKVNRKPAFDTLTPTDTEVHIKEGDQVKLLFEANDPDGDALSYRWSINGVEQTAGNGSSGSYQFKTAFLPADGWDSTKCSPCFMSVNVSDLHLTVENEWRITVDNVNRAPVVSIDRPSEGASFLVGQEVNLKAASTYDPDKDQLTYTWDFGDRRTDTGVEVNHKYVQNGKYTVTLSVTDGHAPVARTLNLSVVIPILKIDSLDVSPASVQIGQIVTITISVMNTGDADASNVKVVFYIGAVLPDDKLTELTIANVSANKRAEINTTWVTDKLGSNVVIAQIAESTTYQLDSYNKEKRTNILVNPKPSPPVNNPMASPLVIGGIVGCVAVGCIVGFVLYKRKKDADAKEEAAVKAIMDAKTKPTPYQPKAVEESPYDRTDFKFGPTTRETRPCNNCRKMTHNVSGLCDDCSAAKRDRDARLKMMTCPVCGNEVSRDMFTCPYCHFNFSKAEKGEVEAVEKKHEAVGYVSDDACADCGVMFNDGMSVLKCPSCQARYHKRCAERLANCAECNGELSSGMSMVFKAPAAPDTELAETVPIKPEEIEEEEARTVPKERPVFEEKRPSGPTCPNCGHDVEANWKVCPSCDADLVPKVEVPPKPPEVEKPKEVPPVVAKIMAKVEAAPAPLTNCPKCSEEVEPDWKVCPSCDAQLGAKVPMPPKPVAPPKPVVRPRPKEEPKVEATVGGKCPKCGDEVETDWKVCPNCDTVLRPAKVPEVKPKEDEAGKKKIVWSKTAKDKALSKEPVVTKPEEKTKVEAKPEIKKPSDEGLKEELDIITKEIEGLEKQGKDVKKAKSLATLASSFLKGKQPDKTKIYIERARAELKKS